MGLGSIRVRLCHEIHARPADHERPGHGFTGLSDKPEMSPFTQRSGIESSGIFLITHRPPAESDAFGTINELQQRLARHQTTSGSPIPDTAVDDTAVAARAATPQHCHVLDRTARLVEARLGRGVSGFLRMASRESIAAQREIVGNGKLTLDSHQHVPPVVGVGHMPPFGAAAADLNAEFALFRTVEPEWLPASSVPS